MENTKNHEGEEENFILKAMRNPGYFGRSEGGCKDNPWMVYANYSSALERVCVIGDAVGYPDDKTGGKYLRLRNGIVDIVFGWPLGLGYHKNILRDAEIIYGVKLKNLEGGHLILKKDNEDSVPEFLVCGSSDQYGFADHLKVAQILRRAGLNAKIDWKEYLRMRGVGDVIDEILSEHS